MSKSKTPEIIRVGREYLEKVAADPVSYPPEVSAMAKYIGVSRRLLYKREPAIQKLVSDLEDLQGLAASVPPGLVLTPDDAAHPYADVSQEDLNDSIQKTVERAVWAAKKFVAQRSRVGAASEASLAAYDLDTCLGQLRAAQNDLRPLVDEWMRRRAPDGLDPGSDSWPDGDLFLDQVRELPSDLLGRARALAAGVEIDHDAIIEGETEL